MSHNKEIFLGAFVFFVLIAAGIALAIIFTGGAEDAAVVEEQSLGSEIFDAVENPTEDLPQANPFESNQNPFSDVFINPFAQ